MHGGTMSNRDMDPGGIWDSTYRTVLDDEALGDADAGDVGGDVIPAVQSRRVHTTKEGKARGNRGETHRSRLRLQFKVLEAT
jgi:hypothetical protein